jgi:hypothetical protein
MSDQPLSSPVYDVADAFAATCSLHDALAAERRGIPAVAIITERFAQTARGVAELNGLPDCPFVTIGHPIANDRDEDLRAKAEAAVAGFVPLLTGHPRA